MNTLTKITIENLKLNKKRTFGTILGITLATMLISTVLFLFSSLYQTEIDMIKNNFGNYHIRLEEIEEHDIASLKLNRDIKTVNPVYYIGKGKVVLKTSGEWDFFISSMEEEVAKNLGFVVDIGKYPEKEDELLISHYLLKETDYQIGDTITIDVNQAMKSEYLDGKAEENEILVPKTYKIVGVIEKGRGETSFYAISGKTKGFASVGAYLTLKNLKNYKEISSSLCSNYYKDTNYCSISTNDNLILTQTFDIEDVTVKMIIGFCSIILFIITIMSIYCIKNAFLISLTEKMKLYGMLNSVGATKKQIKKSVIIEGVLLGIIGIPFGILFGIMAIYLLIFGINTIIGEYYLETIRTINVHISLFPIVLATFLSIATIYFSSLTALRKVKRITPIEVLKNSEERKSKNVKTPKWIKKYFQNGGVIAYKNLKRSKRKYRATVVSLTICTFSFILSNSLITSALNEAKEKFRIENYNVAISQLEYLKDTELEKLNHLSNIKTKYSAYKSGYIGKSENKSDGYLEIYDLSKIIQNPNYSTIHGDNCTWKNRDKICENAHTRLNLTALDDNTYKAYLRELNLDNKNMKGKGILVELKDSNRDYTYEENDTIKGIYHGKEMAIEVGKITSKEPLGIPSFERGRTLVVALSDYPHMNFMLHSMTFDSENPYQIVEDILNINPKIEVHNLEAELKREKSIFHVFELFLYSFILMISFIGMLNILNTITSNVKFRQSEFATLKSIGMTKKEFNRMINLEIIFYTLKSFLFGNLLGIVGIYIVNSYFLHKEFFLPYQTILFTLIFVFLFVFMVMHYSSSKIQKQNIIETIRKENI